jgi:branched-chain amino acid transport system substrate-binding protein
LVFLGLLATFRIASGEPAVEIGLLVDLSGRTRDVGMGVQRVSEMAVETVNGQGGVNGRPVRLRTIDTRGDPILGKEGARELLYLRRVSAVVGPTDWATAMMTKPFFEETRIPGMMLTWEDSVIRGGKFGTYDWVFRLPLRRSMALGIICGFAREQGWSRVGLVAASDSLGREAREWFDRASPRNGIEGMAIEPFVSLKDLTYKLFNLIARDPQVIVSWCPLPHAVAVAKVLGEWGMNLPLFQCHEIPLQDYVEMAGPAAKGSLTVSNKMLVWEELDDGDPQKWLIQDFVHRYRYGTRKPIRPLLAYVWDSIMILVRSIQEVGTDGPRLRDAIEGIHRHVGLGGIYGFTHQDHNGLDPESMVVIRVEPFYGEGSRWLGSWKLAN